MAKIKISPENRLDLIAIAAGQPDPDKRVYRDGCLEVDGVTQEALEDAAWAPVVIPPLEKIKTLEAEQEKIMTARRLREHLAGTDGGWLANAMTDIDDQIKAERAKF